MTKIDCVVGKHAAMDAETIIDLYSRRLTTAQVADSLGNTPRGVFPVLVMHIHRESRGGLAGALHMCGNYNLNSTEAEVIRHRYSAPDVSELLAHVISGYAALRILQRQPTWAETICKLLSSKFSYATPAHFAELWRMLAECELILDGPSGYDTIILRWNIRGVSQAIVDYNISYETMTERRPITSPWCQLIRTARDAMSVPFAEASAIVIPAASATLLGAAVARIATLEEDYAILLKKIRHIEAYIPQLERRGDGRIEELQAASLAQHNVQKRLVSEVAELRAAKRVPRDLEFESAPECFVARAASPPSPLLGNTYGVSSRSSSRSSSAARAASPPSPLLGNTFGVSSRGSSDVPRERTPAPRSSAPSRFVRERTPAAGFAASKTQQNPPLLGNTFGVSSARFFGGSSSLYK